MDPIVERVRSATDIVELIGAHVTLRKAGARFSGLCPFHHEKTASFYVNPDLQAFYCFGCQEKGDVFSFLMKHENMSFPEALRFLAERAGIPLPERRAAESSEAGARIREALLLARAWFRDQLRGALGAAGRDYLKRRGVGSEVQERYGLGLSPDSWDGLTRHARSLLSERTLIEAGLAVEAESGRVYDRFRNRLMIPIETAAAAPLGFGGRALGDQDPKYLNSPETAVYRKGSVLFGAGQARDGVRQEGRVVVVEGYFDVIGLVQAGIGGVVGTCGTAMTPDQARLLRRMSDRVILLFDGDSAGIRASQKALDVLVGEAPEVLVSTPPPGQDPDDWVRGAGADTVRRAFDHAKSPVAFLHGLADAGTIPRREAMEHTAGLAARIADPMQRDLWVQEIAARFGVETGAARAAVDARERVHRDAQNAGAHPGTHANAGAQPNAGPGGRGGAARGAGGPGGGSGPGTAGGPRRFGPLVRECLRSALAHPERGEEFAAALTAAGQAGEDLGALLRWIGSQARSGGGAAEAGFSGPGAGSGAAAAILSRAAREHPLAGDLLALSLEAEIPPEDPDAMLARLEEAVIRREAARLNERIDLARDAGDESALAALMEQKIRLAERRAALTRARTGAQEKKLEP